MGFILGGLCFWTCTAGAASSLQLESLTWFELDEKIRHGYTAVILPSGGTEQSGPHMVLGKHNIVIRKSADLIARRLGNTLVAPALPIVPEGAMDDPRGNFAFPGTLGLSDETFEQVLREVVLSLVKAGFKTVLLLGDHGQSQAGQARVAEHLSSSLQASGVRIVHVSAYYDPQRDDQLLLDQGFHREHLGDHGGIADTALLLAADAAAVRRSRLKSWPENKPSGASGQPALATIRVGRQLMQQRVEAAVKQIRNLIPEAVLGAKP